jgi:hypothetical protein
VQELKGKCQARAGLLLVEGKGKNRAALKCRELQLKTKGTRPALDRGCLSLSRSEPLNPWGC